MFDGGIGTVELDSTVIYEGAQSLEIDGGGSTIRPASGYEGVFDLFIADGGADLDLKNLGVECGAIGINIIVPSDATADIAVGLSHMTVVDNGLFGLLVDDGYESVAGIDVTIDSSTISGNGLADEDVDGVLLFERGEGSISATIRQSTSTGMVAMA